MDCAGDVSKRGKGERNRGVARGFVEGGGRRGEEPVRSSHFRCPVVRNIYVCTVGVFLFLENDALRLD